MVAAPEQHAAAVQQHYAHFVGKLRAANHAARRAIVAWETAFGRPFVYGRALFGHRGQQGGGRDASMRRASAAVATAAGLPRRRYIELMDHERAEDEEVDLQAALARHGFRGRTASKYAAAAAGAR